MRPFAFFIWFLLCLSANAQKFSFLKYATTGQEPSPGGLVADGGGNSYIIGSFSSSYNLDLDGGSQLLNSAGGTDIYFAKYAGNGSLLWGHRIGGSLNDRGTGIAVDAAGNVYIAATFRGTVDLDPGPGTQFVTAAQASFQLSDVLVAKYSSTGALLWNRVISGPNEDISYQVTVDPQGNPVVTTSQGTDAADYDPGPGSYPLAVTNGLGTVVLKLNPSGTFLWARLLGATGLLDTRTLAVGNDGSIYVGGYFQQTIDFDPGPGTQQLTAATGSDGFICRLAANGNFGWVAQFGGGNTIVNDLAPAPTGGVYATGSFEEPTDFDPGPGTLILSGPSRVKGFLLKLTGSGALDWANSIGSTLTGNNAAGANIGVDASGNVFLQGGFTGTVDFDPGPATSTLTANNNNFIGKYTPQGLFEWILQPQGAGPGMETYAGIRQMAVYGDEQLLFTGATNSGTDFDPGPGVALLPQPPQGSSNYYLWKLGRASAIRGRTFLDANADGIRQPGEPGLSVLVKAAGAQYDYYALSDSDGNYTLAVDTGNYQVSVPLPRYYSGSLPTFYDVALGTVMGGQDTAKHFGLQPTGLANDLEVWLTPLGPARPGRPTYYQLTYLNRGTNTLSGTARLQFDAATTFTSATPVPTQQSGNELRWTFANLKPLQRGNIFVTLVPSTMLALGSTLHQVASVDPLAGDNSPQNNIDTLQHRVTASFDPNDKTVRPGGDIGEDFITRGDYLDYTVRFQNTGNDTAFVVILRDTLSPLLDWKTLEVVAASHPFRLDVGPEGVTEWRFNNILLPDSNTNEGGSHGFVRYRVRIKNGTAVNSVVRNKAAIYFDFNAPVVTNETTTRITTVTALPSIGARIELRVYPNPARSQLTIEAAELFQWSLRDLNGRLLRSGSRHRDRATLPVAGLASGTYFLTVDNGRGHMVQKIIVE
ncbi:MAG: T9SS type A sorting domain-containing protein [Chitinophagaceae bacterium]|nr:MAG: T9SS type A sorting domain-containing protein [Chitinophagaceae bacterium]